MEFATQAEREEEMMLLILGGLVAVCAVMMALALWAVD